MLKNGREAVKGSEEMSKLRDGGRFGVGQWTLLTAK